MERNIFDDLYFRAAAVTADFTFGVFDIPGSLEKMAVAKANVQKQLKGRSCYGHLGGTLGERLFTRLLELGWFEPDKGKTTIYKVTPLGETKLSELSVDIYKKSKGVLG
jgi:hypothetical protein